MKLAFVCNQNQARSQILSSVFTTMLPMWEVKSFGLIAREGTPLPLIIESVFHDWGLNSKGLFARNLSVHEDELREMDLVVAVTSLIAEEVKALGFVGVILDLEREASQLGIEVVDPQLMPRRQCAFELAKYLKVAVTAFQGIGLIRREPHILALMPNSEKEIDTAIAIALERVAIDASVLIADLIAPASAMKSLAMPSISQFQVDEKTLLITLVESRKDARIYLPKSASMRPSQVYLSKAWQDFIFQFSTKSVTIITPPRRNATGKIADSYLAALYADRIQIIES